MLFHRNLYSWRKKPFWLQKSKNSWNRFKNGAFTSHLTCEFDMKILAGLEWCEYIIMFTFAKTMLPSWLKYGKHLCVKTYVLHSFIPVYFARLTTLHFFTTDFNSKPEHSHADLLWSICDNKPHPHIRGHFRTVCVSHSTGITQSYASRALAAYEDSVGEREFKALSHNKFKVDFVTTCPSHPTLKQKRALSRALDVLIMFSLCWLS